MFYNRDIDGLLRLKDKAENSEISDEIDLAIAALKRKLTKNQLATKLIDKLLHLTKWNEEKIFVCIINASLGLGRRQKFN